MTYGAWRTVLFYYTHFALSLHHLITSTKFVIKAEITRNVSRLDRELHLKLLHVKKDADRLLVIKV